jgi:hypothetical protein
VLPRQCLHTFRPRESVRMARATLETILLEELQPLHLPVLVASPKYCILHIRFWGANGLAIGI